LGEKIESFFKFLLCLGCDDVPWSGKKFDKCNVCGGNGDTCGQQALLCSITDILIDHKYPVQKDFCHSGHNPYIKCRFVKS